VPCGQEILIDSGGRGRPAALAPQHGAQQQKQAVMLMAEGRA